MNFYILLISLFALITCTTEQFYPGYYGAGYLYPRRFCPYAYPGLYGGYGGYGFGGLGCGYGAGLYGGYGYPGLYDGFGGYGGFGNDQQQQQQQQVVVDTTTR